MSDYDFYETDEGSKRPAASLTTAGNQESVMADEKPAEIKVRQKVTPITMQVAGAALQAEVSDDGLARIWWDQSAPVLTVLDLKHVIQFAQTVLATAEERKAGE